MSQEAMALVRQVYEVFNRTGEPPWELLTPDAELDATAIPGFGVIRGRDQALAALRDYAAAFEDWHIEPEEFLDAGDQVMAVVRDGGRLKGTEDTVFNRFTHVWTFRGNRVARWKTFTDRVQALEDLGLRGQPQDPGPTSRSSSD
jgi:ketosteroid isomerase-like protein